MTGDKSHYVYIIRHKTTDKFYIGSRTCAGSPYDDLGKKYFTQASDKKFKKDLKTNRDQYDFIVYSIHDQRFDATETEMKLHKFFYVSTNNKSYNMSIQTSKKFDTTGKAIMRNIHTNEVICMNVDDPRYSSDDYQGIQSGTVAVMDNAGNTSRVSVNDPRYLNGELFSFTKNNAIVKDKDGNVFMVSVNDPRYLNGELVGHTKGKRLAKNLQTNDIIMVDSNDPRFSTGEIIRYVANENTMCVTNGKNNKFINPEDEEKYASKGWHRGSSCKSLKGKKRLVKDGKIQYIEHYKVEEYLNKGYMVSSDKNAKVDHQNRGTRVVNDGVNNKFVDKDKVDEYLQNGYTLGRVPIEIPQTKGRIYVNNQKIQKMIDPEDLDSYIKQGYTRGKVRNKKKSHKGEK